MTRTLRLATLAALVLASACSEPRSSTPEGEGEGGAGGGSGGSGGGHGGSGGYFGATTIYDLQDPARGAVPNTEVVISGVVVTAVLESRQEDGTFLPQNFFVMDPRGGAYSGIYVRNGGSSGPLEVAPRVGEMVMLTGTYVEYFERSQLELLALSVTSAGDVPAPALVNAAEIATGGAKQEEYEGVLVKVATVSVTETPVLGSDDADHGDFRVNATGTATGGVVVGHSFPADYIRQLGDDFESIVGVMDFSFEEARLEPRGNDDFTFLDGTHPGLSVGGDKTVYELQDVAAAGHPRPPSSVVVHDVVVTARTSTRFWAQEQGGGPFSGIQVRVAEGATAPALGDIVTITGTYTEYFEASQLEEATAEVISAGVLPAPVVLTPVELRTGSASAEQWEGVLVEVRDVVNVEDPVNGTDGTDRGDFRVAAAGGTIADGLIVGHIFSDDYAAGEVGDGFLSIAGVLDYSFSEYRLESRGNEDLTFTDGTHPSVPEVGIVSIYRLQDESLADYAGTNVLARVEGVIVTGATNRGFWVQEPGEPRFGGIAVRIPSAAVGLAIPAAGSLVAVHGKVYEYFGKTVLDADLIEVAGPGTMPAPALVTPVEITTGGAAQEIWEGVLVEVRDVENVEDPVLGSDGQDHRDFRVAPRGVASGGVIVGHAFLHDYAGAVGDGFQSIVGVLDFSFDESRLEPRSNDDLTLADGSHPGPIDAGVVTIFDLQDATRPAHPPEGSGVQVQGVVVVAASNRGFWVMEAAGGPFSGIYVRLPPAGGVVAPAVGTLVDLEGTYGEYFDESQITVSLVTARGPATIPAAAVLTPDELATGGASAEAYEGVLVQLSNVENTQDPVLGSDGVDRRDFRVQAFGGTGGLIVGHAMLNDYAGTVGDRFRSIVGVLGFSFGDHKLEPIGNEGITFEDGSNPGGGGPGGLVTIQQIQDVSLAGHPAAGSAVQVTGVVVVATSSRGFWVMEPAGGAYGGIFARIPPASGLLAPAVGTLVELEGTYTEYFDESQIELTLVTELGPGAIPAPAVLTPDALATGGAQSEAYEGVLVQLSGVENSQDPVLGSDGLDHGDWRIQTFGGSGGLIVGHAIGDDYDGAVGDRFQSVVGVLAYSFGEFKVEPRGNADLTFEDGSHPSLVVSTVSVREIQDASSPNHPAANSPVLVQGVIVTAVRANGSFFVMDPAGGPFSGIYCFKPAAVTLPALVEGDVVDLDGTYVEYFDLSELTVTTATVTGSAPVPAPEVLLPSDVATGAATAEQWEGVLVTVQNVAVTVAPVLEGGVDRGGFRVETAPGDAAPADDLIVDDLFPYAYTAARTTTDLFTSITGLVDYSFSEFRLQPRRDSDLVQ